MKAIILIILLAINIAICSSPRAYTALRNSDSKLLNFLNIDFKNIIKEQNFDPYQSKEQFLQFENKKISFKGKFNDFEIKNLSHYTVMKLSVNYWLRRVTAEIIFSHITSKGFYDIDFTYEKNHYIGRGYYQLSATNVLVSCIAGTNMFGDLEVKRLKLKITLGNLYISASNELLNSAEKSKEWSANLSKIIPRIIADNHKPITTYLSDKLIVFINNLIKSDGIV